MAPPTLESLPYDIKHEIYKHALCRDGPIHVHNGPGQGLGAGILRVNKALYHDAVDVLYHYNYFHISNGVAKSLPWLLEIGPTNLAKSDLSGAAHACAVRDEAEEPGDSGVEYGGLNPNSIINHIARFKDVAAIQQVTNLTLDGEILTIWLMYFNRVMRKPVAYTNPPMKWGLKDAINGCESEIEELDAILVDLGADEQNSPDTYRDHEVMSVLQVVDWNWEEPTFVLDGKPLDDEQGGVFDEPEKYDLGSTVRLFRGVQGLEVMTEALDLHSGNYWPPMAFHLRDLEITERKYENLVGFWNEVRQMGILEWTEE
ncbi:hypothetical protein BCR34DRAFT_608559 [Clohesyomyces aquaticus]|uniref:Uncharacterized protein n=1 Tax=Clohesyomyces aquaticus TaxID=1231657 RepID=A0A1Y1Y624_9PLEO|nr:hypothetical protein BCR34DRAFT_608559 [Clohesyomyces aquaticus]